MVIHLWPDLRVLECKKCHNVIAMFSWEDALQLARLVMGMNCRQCGREIELPNYAEYADLEPEHKRKYEARGFVW